jgi:AraC-like DNA-binding protein
MASFTSLRTYVGKMFVNYESHADFRLLTLRLCRNGVMIAGILGILLTLSYVFANVYFNNREMVWWYGEPESRVVVMLDKIAIILFSITAVILSRFKISLGVLRLTAAALIFLIAFATQMDDIMNRNINLSVGFLFLILVVTAGTIPFKPWQILLVSFGILLLYNPGIMIISEFLGVTGLYIQKSHIIFLSIGIVMITGISTLLYHSRYQQYMAKRSADGFADIPFQSSTGDGISGGTVHHEQDNEPLHPGIANELLVSEISVPSTEEIFLEKVKKIIEEHIGDSNFGVEWLAYDAGISPRHLQRKLRASVGLSAAELIRLMRLQRASQLLEQQAGNVSEVAYKVGYQDVNYFSKLFRDTFEITPSEYAKSTKSGNGS